MMRTTLLGTVIFCLIVTMSLSSVAGVLYEHPNAFDDNSGPATGGKWSGTVHFDNTGSGGNLEGDLDWAVFPRTTFNALFGGLGYTPPGDLSGELVYTYQLFNEGSDAITAEIVGIVNPANTIGQFEIGDIMPSSAMFVGTNARWLYSAPAIGTGESSWGMAFSSPNVPMSGVGLTVDGGASVVTLGVATPSADAIPEASSILILSVLGGLTMFLRRYWG